MSQLDDYFNSWQPTASEPVAPKLSPLDSYFSWYDSRLEEIRQRNALQVAYETGPPAPEQQNPWYTGAATLASKALGSMQNIPEAVAQLGPMIQGVGEGTLFRPITQPVGALVGAIGETVAAPFQSSAAHLAGTPAGQEIQAAAARGYEQAGPVGKFGLDVLGAGETMAEIALAGPAAAGPVMFAGSAGEALRRGWDPRSAALSGAVEAGSESLGFGTISRIAEMVDGPALRTLGEVGKRISASFGQEAAEEMAAGLGQEIIRRYSAEPTGKPLTAPEILEIVKDVLYQGAVGGVSGGALGGVGAATRYDPRAQAAETGPTAEERVAEMLGGLSPQTQATVTINGQRVEPTAPKPPEKNVTPEAVPGLVQSIDLPPEGEAWIADETGTVPPPGPVEAVPEPALPPIEVPAGVPPPEVHTYPPQRPIVPEEPEQAAVEPAAPQEPEVEPTVPVEPPAPPVAPAPASEVEVPVEQVAAEEPEPTYDELPEEAAPAPRSSRVQIQEIEGFPPDAATNQKALEKFLSGIEITITPRRREARADGKVPWDIEAHDEHQNTMLVDFPTLYAPPEVTDKAKIVRAYAARIRQALNGQGPQRIETPPPTPEPPRTEATQYDEPIAEAREEIARLERAFKTTKLKRGSRAWKAQIGNPLAAARARLRTLSQQRAEEIEPGIGELRSERAKRGVETRAKNVSKKAADAFDSGTAAFSEGRTLDDNPFNANAPTNTTKAQLERDNAGAWAEGWKEAQRKAQEDEDLAALDEAIAEEEEAKRESLGIVAESPTDKLVDKVLSGEESAKFLDKEVERRWNANRGIKAPGILTRAKEAVRKIAHAATRYYPQLDPKNREHVLANDLLRRYRAAEGNAGTRALDQVDVVTKDLTPEEGDLLGRVLALRDIVRSFDEGLYDRKDAPFFKTRAAAAAELERMEGLAGKSKKVQTAITERNTRAANVVRRLVAADILPKETLNNVEAYFHRQVMAKQAEQSSTGSSTLRLTKKGFQRARTGGGEFNTSYQQAEYDWLTDAYQLLAKKAALDEMRARLDTSGKLKDRAKRELGDEKRWKELIPETHALWQPERGSHFYPALTIQEKAVDEILAGQRELQESDLREALALGQKKEEWVLPKEVIEVLEKEFTEDRSRGFDRVWAGGESAWKQAVLFGPFRALKYNLRNLISDVDFVLGLDPKILKGVPKWSRRLWAHQVTRKASPELRRYMLRLADLGVIDSGFAEEEVAKLNRIGLLKTMKETERGVTERVASYYGTVKTLTTWRENVLRAAAFERALDLVKKSRSEGKRIYWASKASEVDGLYDSNAGSEEIAAKLAREAIGDYGDRSEMGRWMRTHVQPFWSWTELNAGRYRNLFANASTSRLGVVGRAARGLALRGGFNLALRSAQVTALYALAAMWNREQYPEEDKILNRGRREYHLILGRTEDGEIRSIPVSGALADILSWVAMEDVAGAAVDLTTGKRSMKEAAAEAIKAPVDKIARGWEPLTKTAGELISGRSAYPSIFEKGTSSKLAPRSIISRGQHLAGVVGFRPLYDAINHIPQRGRSVTEKLVRGASPFNYTNPEESAMFMARDLARDFKGGGGGGFEKDDKALAAYYLKKSKQIGDKGSEAYWAKEFKELGGTKESLEKSIKGSSPWFGIAKRDRSEFLKSLSEEDRKVFVKGLRFYAKTMGVSETSL